MSHRPRLLCAIRRRRAITVVEVLAALMVLSAGILAMAGTSTISLRAATSAAMERRAAQHLARRHAALQASGCAGAEGGVHEELDDGVLVRWTAGPAARGVALLDATAEWQDGARWRGLEMRSALLC
jgi:Tfp pilus assembly protein PilV